MITDRPLFGSIDSSFITERKDIYSSGMVAEIGLVAHGVWGALKCHADIGTGETYVGMRAIGEECGISPATVMRAIRTLERAHLVRIVAPGLQGRKGQTVVPRERLTVRLGSRVLCTVVIDYQVRRKTSSKRSGCVATHSTTLRAGLL